MALLNYGTVAGLAYTPDWDQVMNRQFANEQADRQALIDSQNKAKMLGEKLRYDQLSNTWDNKINKQFAESRIQEIGRWVAENPNFENDAGLWGQFNQMSEELTNNETVYRSLRVQQNHDALVAYIQQNPGAESDPSIQQQLLEYDNYNRFGSTDGVTDSGKEFMFRNPDEQFDPLAATATAFSQLAQVEGYDRSGVGIGATKSEVPKEAQYNTAVGLLNGPDGWRYANAWKAMSETDKTYYENDPIKWIMGMGSAYTAKSVQAGTVFAPQRSGGSGGGSGGGGGAMAYSPYYNDFGRLTPGGAATYTPFANALLPITDGKMPVTAPLMVKVTDANGADSWRTLSTFTGGVYETNATGNKMLDPNGQPIMEVSMKVPLNAELGQGDTPLIDNSDWFSWDPDEAKDVPAYSNVARVEKDADGNNTGYAYIRTWVPAPNSSAAIRNYDQVASGTANANKAEGYALYTLTLQERLSSVVPGSERTLPDGRTVGKLADGSYINMQTGEVIQ